MSVTDTDYPPAVTIKSRNDDAVTDAENGADAHFESRNDDAVTDAEGGGAPSFESRNDATARIDALLGLTGKVETPEEKELFWRAYNAQKTAEHCGKCGRVISPDEHITRRSVITPSSRFGRRDNHTVVCDDCGPTRGSKYYHVMWRDGRCQHCGRGVTVREHFARHKNAKFFCSGRCSAGFHNARRDARNALAREKVCEVCSQDFTATRRNAKTCSPACKQKAYRNRQRSQKGGDT